MNPAHAILGRDIGQAVMTVCRCRTCGERIRWLRGLDGYWLAFDAKAVRRGRRFRFRREPGYVDRVRFWPWPGHRMHIETCPGAAK